MLPGSGSTAGIGGTTASSLGRAAKGSTAAGTAVLGVLPAVPVPPTVLPAVPSGTAISRGAEEKGTAAGTAPSTAVRAVLPTVPVPAAVPPAVPPGTGEVGFVIDRSGPVDRLEARVKTAAVVPANPAVLPLVWDFSSQRAEEREGVFIPLHLPWDTLSC